MPTTALRDLVIAWVPPQEWIDSFTRWCIELVSLGQVRAAREALTDQITLISF